MNSPLSERLKWFLAHRNGKVIRKGRIEDLRTCDSKMYSTRNGLQLQQVHGAQLRAAARVEVVFDWIYRKSQMLFLCANSTQVLEKRHLWFHTGFFLALRGELCRFSRFNTRRRSRMQACKSQQHIAATVKALFVGWMPVGWKVCLSRKEVTLVHHKEEGCD